MGSTELERVNKMKYLGVILDENFNWSPHIAQLKLKLAGSVGILSKLKYYLDTKILIQVYHALVGSRLHYAIGCWGLLPKLSFNQSEYSKTGRSVLFRELQGTLD